MSGRTRLAILGVTFVLVAGCSSSLRAVDLDTEENRREFGFLVDGKTSKEETLSRLGRPYSEFEQSRILTYLPNSRYELVLVFDEHNVLKRHSLLQRR